MYACIKKIEMFTYINKSIYKYIIKQHYLICVCVLFSIYTCIMYERVKNTIK